MGVRILEEEFNSWLKSNNNYKLFFDKASKGNLGVAGF
jgi:hypothetical protein